MGRGAQHVGPACLIARRAWTGCPRPNHTCASKLDKAGQTISIVFLATQTTARVNPYFSSSHHHIAVDIDLADILTTGTDFRHDHQQGFHPARGTDPNQPESRHPLILAALSTSSLPSHRHGERVPTILRSSANWTEFKARTKVWRSSF